MESIKSKIYIYIDFNREEEALRSFIFLWKYIYEKVFSFKHVWWIMFDYSNAIARIENYMIYR